MALETIRGNKLRSALTILGVVIGITSIVGMTSLIRGFDSSLRATIEGHADARGTNEYNLSLGQKRADAVKEYLVSLGIQGDRLSTLSKGEEQQVCSEQNEGCWSRNRRGHFIVTAR